MDKKHCIVPDHIGMGLSDKPEEGEYSFTLKQRVDDLDKIKQLVISNTAGIIFQKGNI